MQRRPGLLVLTLSLLGPLASSAHAASAAIEVSAAERSDQSAPLTLMRQGIRTPHREHVPGRLPRPGPGAPTRASALSSVLAPATLAAATPVPGPQARNFEGMGQRFTGPTASFQIQSAPPDTNGDIGPSHYVQLVNSDLTIFTRDGQGGLTPSYGPVPLQSVWSGFGGRCESDNDGDPVVLYDQLADRWILTQFAVSDPAASPTFYECVAVSSTSNPQGAYNRYAFPYQLFNDYPKLSVWPDAYYVTYNTFDRTPAFKGAKVCALDRASMIAGSAATQQCFNTPVSYGGLLPADVDGQTLPPAGAPVPILALSNVANNLALWTYHVDWTTPANTHVTGPTQIPVAPFNSACSSAAAGACIPQPVPPNSGPQVLQALADRLMFRLAYRNFGDHEALVVNHSIDANGPSGVRWYELRQGATPGWNLYQQGTQSPDGDARWMGSAAMDKRGNMAIAYSQSGTSTSPSLRYAARYADDDVGTMPAGEGALVDGVGTQVALERWGDYSMLSVDPNDDCTFWFTSEYLAGSGRFNWHTRIGSFKLPGCVEGAGYKVLPATQLLAPSGQVSFRVVTPAAGPLSVSGLPTGISGVFQPSSPAPGQSAYLVLTATGAAAGSYPFTVNAGGATASATVQVQAPDFSLSLPSPTLNLVQGRATIQLTTAPVPASGAAENLAITVSGLPANTQVEQGLAPIAAGGSVTFDITASVLSTSSAPPVPVGSYPIHIQATSRSTSHTVDAMLVVGNDWRLRVRPNERSVKPGATAHFSVLYQQLSGSSPNATISVTGVPAGVTLSPANATLAAGTGTDLVAVTPSGGVARTPLTVTVSDGVQPARTSQVFLGTTASPKAVLTSPAPGALLRGSTPVFIDNLDPSALGVYLQVDATFVAPVPSSGYSLDTTRFPDGPHVLSAVLVYPDNSLVGTDDVAVRFSNPPAPPPSATVQMVTPQAAATVSGTINLLATTTDGPGGAITQVEFFVDGSSVGKSTGPTWQISWDSGTVAPGPHTITAKATDTAGTVVTTLAGVTITVAAPPPAPKSGCATGGLGGGWELGALLVLFALANVRRRSPVRVR